jgi:succinate-semialdehyde dehydrogenase / glutarate-semialdehyde dehydrogenase
MARHFYSLNPATEEIEATLGAHSADYVDSALDRAVEVARVQRMSSISARCDLLQRLAGTLEANEDHLSELMTREMGKTRVSARAEVKKCAAVCRYYAERGPEFLRDHPVETDAPRAFVRYLPLGPLLAIMPWNFPLWQVFRFAAPAVMAGNTVLLKHASNVPRCAMAIEGLFQKAGGQAGLFQTLLIGSDDVDEIIADTRIRGVTFTGSEAAGRQVARAAGGAIKKSVLELGGSDAFIVMPSARLDKAVKAAITSRTLNNGQSCIAAKRFLIHEDVYVEFRARFVAGIMALKVGDPMNEATDLGPLATAQIRGQLNAQIEDAIEAGARRLVGAEIREGKGFYFAPGVIEGVSTRARAYDEELFGPVGQLYAVRSFDDAIDQANRHALGLGSALFTQDRAEMEAAITQIEAGATFINQYAASDPRLPFGGVKNSGYGRELSRAGLLEWVNEKAACIG